MSNETKNEQGTPNAAPAGVKAGNGKYFFELASVEEIHAGGNYSTAMGPLVAGERIQCALINMPKGTGARPHSHPNEQWIWVIQGELDFEIDGVKQIAGPGMLIYIPADTIHTTVAVPNKGDVVFFTCKDMTHGIVGNAVDQTTSGPRFVPGYESK